MQTLQVEQFGLTPLNEVEVLGVFGGDTGYYGKGPNLDRLSAIAHEMGDFVAGFFDGLFNS